MAKMFLVRVKISGTWHDKVLHSREEAYKIIDGLKNIPAVDEGHMFECEPTYLSYRRVGHKPYRLG